MASLILGRTACPECGNASAHVKQSDKCLYRYCPECGAQYFAKTPRQVEDLKAKTRFISAGVPPSPPTEPKPPAGAANAAPTPASGASGTGDAPPPPPPPAKRGLFF